MSETLFRIGVGGHQDLGDEATQRIIAQQFRELLVTYQQQGHTLLLYSALAIGADQLFVQIALELEIPVEAVLPCTEYEANYRSEEAYNEYRRLLASCRITHQLSYQKCSGDAYLAAGQWIVEQSDLTVLAWNGQPSQGRGGTGDMASYARFLHRPFVHIHTREQTVKTYGNPQGTGPLSAPLKKDLAMTKQQVYQGLLLTVNQYRFQQPDGEEVIRDVVERPDSVLVVPVSQGRKGTIVLLIEEYDLGAGAWQLKLPGGRVESDRSDMIVEQAQRELRQEIGYSAGRLEKLANFYSHPGYISHKVHTFVAQDLEWNPLELERHEEIRVQTYTLKEALAATLEDYRCDPESALALWLYAQTQQSKNE